MLLSYVNVYLYLPLSYICSTMSQLFPSASRQKFKMNLSSPTYEGCPETSAAPPILQSKSTGNVCIFLWLVLNVPFDTEAPRSRTCCRACAEGHQNGVVWQCVFYTKTRMGSSSTHTKQRTSYSSHSHLLRALKDAIRRKMFGSDDKVIEEVKKWLRI